jgi:hypothetical protein
MFTGGNKTPEEASIKSVAWCSRTIPKTCHTYASRIPDANVRPHSIYPSHYVSVVYLQPPCHPPGSWLFRVAEENVIFGPRCMNLYHSTNNTTHYMPCNNTNNLIALLATTHKNKQLPPFNPRGRQRSAPPRGWAQTQTNFARGARQAMLQSTSAQQDVRPTHSIAVPRRI